MVSSKKWENGKMKIHNSSARPYRTPEMLAEIERKELGIVSHLLDGVWDEAPKTAVIAIGIAATWSHLAGGFAAYMVPTAAILAQAKAGLRGLVSWLDAKDNARVYDSPAFQAALGDIEAKARGVVASQRGTVWIVSESDIDPPKVMSDREYANFRRSLASEDTQLVEVKIKNTSVQVSRLIRGKLDSGRPDLPAIETYDISSGRRNIAEWFSGGRKSPKPAEPHYPATRILAEGFRDIGRMPPSREEAAPAPAFSPSRFLRGEPRIVQDRDCEVSTALRV